MFYFNHHGSSSSFCSTGLPGEEERVAFSHFQSKKLDEWNEHMLNQSHINPMVDVIKQEVAQSGNFYHHDQEFQVSGAPWSHMVPVSSSPRSSVASFSSDNLLDSPYNKEDHRKNQLPDHTSEVRPMFFFYIKNKIKVFQKYFNSLQNHLNHLSSKFHA